MRRLDDKIETIIEELGLDIETISKRIKMECETSIQITYLAGKRDAYKKIYKLLYDVLDEYKHDVNNGAVKG